MSAETPPLNSPKSAEQSLQELVYAVAHDLGASARTIHGFADLLSRRYGESLDKEAQKFLQLLSDGASTLQAQLDGLLRYSRVESRGEPLVPTDVGAIWQLVQTEAAGALREAKASVAEAPLPIISADTQQLHQLLAELLQNAIKFRRQAALQLSLTATQSEQQANSAQARWLFRFTDNGRGIAPQHLQRAFQMFQRCHTDVPGVGAGLAICQRIVQRHGGTIWAESAVDHGTTICFTMMAPATRP
jgi:light-regulated signal transduction histidine kinase (bacteriophytochrome)